MIDCIKAGTNSKIDSTGQTKFDERVDTNNSKKRNFRQRGGGIYYGAFDMSSDDELEFQLTKKVLFPTKVIYLFFSS